MTIRRLAKSFRRRIEEFMDGRELSENDAMEKLYRAAEQETETPTPLREKELRDSERLMAPIWALDALKKEPRKNAEWDTRRLLLSKQEGEEADFLRADGHSDEFIAEHLGLKASRVRLYFIRRQEKLHGTAPNHDERSAAPVRQHDAR